MKKYILRIMIGLCIVAMTSTSFAQTFTVKGGLNLSSMSIKDDDETYSDNFEMKPGFHLGGLVGIPINDMFSVEGGMFLSMKGFNASDEGSFLGYNYDSDANLELYYLDIPITAKISAGTDELKIWGAAGPYIGIGIAGTKNGSFSFEGITGSSSEDVEWGSDDGSDLQQIDVGYTIGAGVEMGALLIGLSYNQSISNNASNTDNGMTVKNGVIALSVGIILGDNDSD